MKTVSIIDFNVGNIYSVVQACKEIGLKVNLTSEYEEIINSDGVILPGVGAFGTAMKNLKKEGLDLAINDFVLTGKPFMGICLGLQLLFSESDEFGFNQGLDIIKGKVLKFNNSDKKVPQVGWNKIYNNDNNKEEEGQIHSRQLTIQGVKESSRVVCEKEERNLCRRIFPS